MSEQIEKAVIGSVRLDSDVWAAVRALPVSLNQFLRLALLSNPQSETHGEGIEALAKKHGKVSKKNRAILERAASDVVAQSVGREDIDYSDVESAPTVNVANLRGTTGAMAAGTQSAMDKWRANRKPIGKPKEQK